MSEVAEQHREQLKGHGALQVGIDDIKSETEAQGRANERTNKDIERINVSLKDQITVVKAELTDHLASLGRDLDAEERNRDAATRDMDTKHAERETELRALIVAERTARAEADDKLRSDVVEALQKEVASRQDGDKSVIETLTRRVEKEANDRSEHAKEQDEAVETLEAALMEMRESLDTLEALGREEPPAEPVSPAPSSRSGKSKSRR
jgi:hypothetical protein